MKKIHLILTNSLSRSFNQFLFSLAVLIISSICSLTYAVEGDFVAPQTTDSEIKTITYTKGWQEIRFEKANEQEKHFLICDGDFYNAHCYTNESAESLRAGRGVFLHKGKLGFLQQVIEEKERHPVSITNTSVNTNALTVQYKIDLFAQKYTPPPFDDRTLFYVLRDPQGSKTYVSDTTMMFTFISLLVCCAFIAGFMFMVYRSSSPIESYAQAVISESIRQSRASTINSAPGPVPPLADAVQPTPANPSDRGPSDAPPKKRKIFL